MAKRSTKAGRQSSSGAMTPLPSLIRASAWDAGNNSMRAAGRTKWSRKDFNAAAATQERLVHACYGRDTDTDPRRCYIRFAVAEQMQANGDLCLGDDWPSTIDAIDEALDAPAEQAA
jgi:hypothetical protein